MFGTVLLDSLTSSPYSLFSLASNSSRVSHRGLLHLLVWPGFSQALELEGLSVRQDWVLRKASRRMCGENRPWGQCICLRTYTQLYPHFLQLTRRLNRETFILSNLVKLVQKQAGRRGQKRLESTNCSLCSHRQLSAEGSCAPAGEGSPGCPTSLGFSRLDGRLHARASFREIDLSDNIKNLQLQKISSTHFVQRGKLSHRMLKGNVQENSSTAGET